MAPVFIFAELVQSVVRSGKKEIEIPEGARISSAAADLIRENKIRIKTVAPGGLSSGSSPKPAKKSTQSAGKADIQPQVSPPAEILKGHKPPGNSAEITEDEVEDIVNRVLERFKHLKGSSAGKTIAADRKSVV